MAEILSKVKSNKVAQERILIIRDENYFNFQQYFSYIVAVRYIGGGNQGTRVKSQTCCLYLPQYLAIIELKTDRYYHTTRTAHFYQSKPKVIS